MTQHSIPLVIAHRGAAGEAPENTLAAFRLGMEQGCDGIELDIHLTKDGELVVIHDPTLNRTTNGIGAVAEQSLAEIRQYDAGGWFHESFAGERIPTLEEVIDLAPPELLINVEIKGGIGKGVEETLARLLRRKNRLDTVVVSSFDFKSLAILKELEPSVKIGLLYNNRLAHHWKLPAAAGIEVYSLHMSMKRLDKEDAEAARQHGYAVYPWTVNDADKMRLAISYGADAIITDYPGRLRALLREVATG
ncbi:glycerophosphodiester phosphodiesterase [Paenibacillus caui]|uniref:glycerophosphodiester phosphodiesterase n=1 Tax=Paenibacillus caui TaxID=2873927 RepID=UPI001CA995B8|nr:glycerophosphodiester phosphodiesterase [Paenibacillus caui]